LLLVAVGIGFAWSLLAIVISGPVAFRTPRLEVETRPEAERLRETVRTLSQELAPLDFRNPGNLDRAADWIAEQLEASGLAVSFQAYDLPEGSFRNVVGFRPGNQPGAGALILGAHYDTYGGHPGADDNASGVAVLLEVARTVSNSPTRGDRYFVAFGTEEPPFFRTDGMGSYVFAKSLVERGVTVELMVALDSVGFYSDEPGSQQFPLPGLGWLYPRSGSFAAVVGDLFSGDEILRVKSGMLQTRSIVVHSFRAPTAIPGVDWSDHFSFRRLGLPGVLVTDTAFMRNPHYHTAADTAEKLDYERMALLVQALHGVFSGPQRSRLSGHNRSGSPPATETLPDS